jgi:hypothetical protein
MHEPATVPHDASPCDGGRSSQAHPSALVAGAWIGEQSIEYGVVCEKTPEHR